MNNNDIQAFSDAINMARANYDKPPLDDAIKFMWLQQLSEYSIEQVQQSIMKHLRTSQFAPKLADLILGLQGAKPKAREILAAARLKNSPFGVMAAMHIGTFDLNTLKEYALETRAEEIVDLYSEWEASYSKGELSNGVIAVIAKSNVMLNAPFRPDGVPPTLEASNRMIGIANTSIAQNHDEANALRIEQQRLDAFTPEQRQSNRARLLALVSDLGKPEPPKINDVTCSNCGHKQIEILKKCEQCEVKRDD